MTTENETYGMNVLANGRNWNFLRLLIGQSGEVKGHQLRQVNFHLMEDGVRIVLKKDSPKGPQVAFLHGTNLDAALFVVAASIKSKTIPWKADKWRK